MQPRWGNRVGLTRVTQGTRRCREPWAWESNAVGVGAIGRRVRSEGRDGRKGLTINLGGLCVLLFVQRGFLH